MVSNLVRHLHVLRHSHRLKDYVTDGMWCIHKPLGRLVERYWDLVLGDMISVNMIFYAVLIPDVVFIERNDLTHRRFLVIVIVEFNGLLACWRRDAWDSQQHES